MYGVQFCLLVLKTLRPPEKSIEYKICFIILCSICWKHFFLCNTCLPSFAQDTFRNTHSLHVKWSLQWSELGKNLKCLGDLSKKCPYQISWMYVQHFWSCYLCKHRQMEWNSRRCTVALHESRCLANPQIAQSIHKYPGVYKSSSGNGESGKGRQLYKYRPH
jgi:hypothetical protein